MRAFAGEDPDLATIFPVVAERPLPDGSRAIIRARRIPPLAGVEPAEVARRLEKAQAAAMADFVRDAVGLRITLDYRPDAILRGEVDRVRVEVEAATIGELKRRDRAPLRVRDVRVEVDRLLVNPASAHALGRDRGARRGRAPHRARRDHAGRSRRAPGRSADGAPAQRGVHRRVGRRARQGPAGLGEGGHGSRDPDVALRPQGRRSEGRRAPVPDALVDWVVRHFDPTNRLRNLPVPVSIAPIQIKSGRFEIGALERG